MFEVPVADFAVFEPPTDPVLESFFVLLFEAAFKSVLGNGPVLAAAFVSTLDPPAFDATLEADEMPLVDDLSLSPILELNVEP